MTQPQFAQQFALGPVEKKYPIEPKQTEIDFSSFLQGDQGQQPAVAPALETAAVAVQTASPQDLESVKTELSNNPQAVNDVLARASQEDATGGDGSNLSNFDKVAMGLMALLPILGNALGGKDGALTGLGAAAQGIGVGAQMQQQEDLLGLKVGANKKNADRTQERFNRQDKRESNKVKLSLQKDWRNDKVRASFRSIKIAAGKIFSTTAERKDKKGGRGQFDTAAAFAFMRLLDETSTVRESEFRNVEAAQNVQDRIKAWRNNFGNKSFLGADAKRQMREIANDTMKLYGAELQIRVQELRETARQQEIEPDHLVKESFVQDNIDAFNEYSRFIKVDRSSPVAEKNTPAKEEKGFIDKAKDFGDDLIRSIRREPSPKGVEPSSNVKSQNTKQLGTVKRSGGQVIKHRGN